ncbi:MAG: pyruvate kinase [Bacteroidia bacterium]
MMTEKAALHTALSALSQGMAQAVAQHQHRLQQLRPEIRPSARNLIEYLYFRSESLKDIQEALHCLGYSSLASSEGHIRTQLHNVLALIEGQEAVLDLTAYASGNAQLQQNARTLFGDATQPEQPYIMVTLDGQLATEAAYVSDLIRHGMNIARINCAHDHPQTWLQMIGRVREAAAELQRGCKIYMDLAGPKIRTNLAGAEKLKVKLGNQLWLAEKQAQPPKKAKILRCTLAGVVDLLEVGQRVLIDDGLIAARVLELKTGMALLEITRISGKKPYIKPEKGMNFPDSRFDIPALTQYDLDCLPFVLEHADMLGLSFVNRAADLTLLHEQLASLGHPQFPVVAKIETQEAVRQLAAIVLQGMAGGPFGVMIARGDLAVEIGFERLSEVQEEILWICEAAHIPVVWATQVLESLNKQGLATRSEVTDAARSAFAECVMINKGKYTREVLISLVDILARSRSNNLKQRHIFRALNIAKAFFAEGELPQPRPAG